MCCRNACPNDVHETIQTIWHLPRHNTRRLNGTNYSNSVGIHVGINLEEEKEEEEKSAERTDGPTDYYCITVG